MAIDAFDSDNTSNEIAYPVQVAEHNPKVQQLLKNALTSGKTVYLYGDLTLEKYENILGIKGELTTPKSDAELKANSTNTPREYVQIKGNADVIGYSLNPTDPYRLYIAQFDSSKKETYMYMRAIFDHQIHAFNKTQKTASLFKNNRAYADSTSVRIQPNITKYIYTSDGTLVGWVNTDWILYQDKNETDPTYDRFSVEDDQEVYSYNGYDLQVIDTTHSLPWASSDNIYRWGPPDTSTSAQIQFSIPWNLSISFNPNDSVVIDDQGSQTYDYAKWNVQGPWYDFVLNSPTRFYPGTAWFSIGTYAGIDLEHTITYDNGWGVKTTGTQVINVRYDY